MEYITLSNGVQLPAIGSGTNSFGKEGGSKTGAYIGDPKELLSAIDAGYRFFDTAESYGNEEMLGRVIKESGLPRSEFVISTKMATVVPWIKSERVFTAADAEKAITQSLEKLGTDYIDLYFMHFPCPENATNVALWKVFEKYYRQGVIKALGVSNYDPEQIAALMAEVEIAPVVAQLRVNPDVPNKEAVAWLQAQGIQPIGWCPLSFDAKFREPFAAIGAKYGKSWSQTVLRYLYQRGIVTIPKSHNPEHQKQNLEIFDFELSAGDVAALDKVSAEA